VALWRSALQPGTLWRSALQPGTTFPTVICPGVTFPTVICPGVTFPTVWRSALQPGTTFPTVICPGVIFPTVICPGVTFPTVICPGVSFPKGHAHSTFNVWVASMAAFGTMCDAQTSVSFCETGIDGQQMCQAQVSWRICPFIRQSMPLPCFCQGAREAVAAPAIWL